MISNGSLKRAAWQIRSWPIRCALISTLLVLPATAGLAADNNDSGTIDLSAYEGHWRRTETSESEVVRKTAIDTAVKELSWLVRKMASGVLRRSTVPPPELQFAWDGQQLYQGLEDTNGGFSRIIELDDEFRDLKDRRGEDFSAAWAWSDQSLRLRWRQHQANGNNIYRLEEDARTLIVEHTIHVTAISDVAPIVYFSRFSRTDLPARAAPGLDHIARVNAD